MKISFFLPACGLILVLSGCATFPKSPEEQARYYGKQAEIAMQEKDGDTAVLHVVDALGKPTGDAVIKELYKSYPDIKSHYGDYLRRLVSDVNDVNSARRVFLQVEIAKSSGLFDHLEINDFENRLSKVVEYGNSTGEINFLLGKDLDMFPVLKESSQFRIVFNRTLSNLKKIESTDRPIGELMNYISLVGLDSDDGKLVRQLLPVLNVRKSELQVVGAVYPEFSKLRESQLSKKVVLNFKNIDRLLSDDMLHYFGKNINGAQWELGDDSKSSRLVIEKIRSEERIVPEQTQTVTYSYHDVDFFNAMLLMPNNASYMFEMTTGGAEIDYGYVVSFFDQGKKVHDKVIRGKADNKYKRCTNMRIQNVFGGVSRAEFIANNDMREKCGGATQVSIEELRENVFSKLVEGILAIPQVGELHKMND